MSGFSAEWLALREPADHAARMDPDLVHWLLPGLPVGRPLRILDLACGTGSNLRCLAGQLERPQHWTLVDHDVALLEAASVALTSWRRQARSAAVDYECRQLDLMTELDGLDFSQFDLVTAAALLDLVSEAWLQRGVDRCRAARAAVLFALSYDGRMRFEPSHRDDARILELFNRHQHGDKGFGLALGPRAPVHSREMLTAAGFEIRANSTPWRLEGGRLQAELIEGFSQAAEQVEPADRGAIDVWRRQRLAYIATGHSRLTVGHEDLAGRPGPA